MNINLNSALDVIMKNPYIQGLQVQNILQPENGVGIIANSMDWAFDQCLREKLPLGLVNSVGLAEEYSSTNSSLQEACDSLIKKELLKISAVGLLTSIGDSKTLALNLPAILFLQLRIVIALAHLGGKDVCDPMVKDICQISLLGNAVASKMRQKLILKKKMKK